MRKGEITAFLSLIFILILSVTAGVIESASIQVTKNKKRGDMDRAMESVFAEYQRELLEKYDVFALEGTYETGDFAEENIIQRLAFYGTENIEQDIQKIQFLTDDSGRAYREQVIACMKNKLGISELESLTDSSGKWKEQEDKTDEYEAEEQEVTNGLDASLAEAGQELPSDENPMATIANIKKSGLLNVVIQNQSDISDKNISLETMPSHRSLQKGKGTFPIKEDTDSVASKLYFGEYLLEKFAAADKPNQEGKLSYELEYIISGTGSDRENLERVVRKLAAVRFAADYGYLMTDEVKKAEAETMALTLAGIVALPALTEVIKHGILLAWAFGEAVIDIRTLLAGGKVELLKTKENWQLQLSSLLKLGTDEEQIERTDSEKGISYKEYLRMLLFAASQKRVVMQSLDVLEMNMQTEKGDFFKVDNCVSKLEMKSSCRLRRGITYEFVTNYGYQ